MGLKRMTNTYSLTTARTWGKPPPYSIFCAFPRGPHPNGILFRDSQMGVLKLPKLGLPQLWGPITLRVDFRLRWSLKQSYSPHWKLSNSMLHATCTQGNRVDSRLLTPDFSLAITCVSNVQMGHVSPFQTST